MKKRKFLIIFISAFLFIYAIFPGFFYNSNVATDKISERILVIGLLIITIFVVYKFMEIIKNKNHGE